MLEKRITGLTLLSIHCDINVNIIKVIDRFSKTKKKIGFAL